MKLKLWIKKKDVSIFLKKWIPSSGEGDIIVIIPEDEEEVDLESITNYNLKDVEDIWDLCETIEMELP